MKKLLSAALAFWLLLGAALPALAATGTKYRVVSSRANVLPEPSVEQTPVLVLPKGTVVTEEASQGNFIRVTVPSAGVTGWVHLGALAPLEVGTSTDGVKEIRVKKTPDKTVYIEGEEVFDASGLEIVAVLTDGSEIPARGWRLFVPSLLTYGTKTVDVVYGAGDAAFYTSFEIEVRKVPVDTLTLLSPPDKTDYIEGQPLDLAGLSLQVTYLDGRPAETYAAAEIAENPAFTLTGCHSEAPGRGVPFGEHTLHVLFRYPEFEVSFKVRAVKKTLLSLTVLTPPDKTTVYTRETPDLTGMTLKAVYDNGEEKAVPAADCELTCDPAAFVLGAGNPIRLTYEGMSVDYALTFALDEPQAIKLRTPTVLTFILGEKIDLDDLKVYLVYRSGKEEETTNYVMSKPDPRRTGAQTVTVTSGSFSDVFTIYITPYYQKGDVDYDAEVTAADARHALRAAVELITLTGRPFQAADADSDGKITAADARLILRAAVDLEDLLHFDDEGE